MEVVFLGVGGGMPSLRRALPAISIRLGRSIILFDCGEGTQIQLQHAGLSIQRITEIYISHMHGDHCLGLPGLISSMSMLHRTQPLIIYGPPGVKSLVNTTIELTQVALEYEIATNEVNSGIISNHHRYTVECLPAIHSIPSLSFIFRIADSLGKFDPVKAQQLGVPKGPLWKQLQQGQPVQVNRTRLVHPREVLGPPRKGASVVYSGDTAPNPRLAKVARYSTLFIHEATYTNEHEEKASEYFHSTAAQAAEIAVLAQPETLALVHISPRYETNQQHEHEARDIFQRTVVPNDLDVIELSNTISVEE